MESLTVSVIEWLIIHEERSQDNMKLKFQFYIGKPGLMYLASHMYELVPYS